MCHQHGHHKKLTVHKTLGRGATAMYWIKIWRKNMYGDEKTVHMENDSLKDGGWLELQKNNT